MIIIYHCFGGSHSSVLAAALHLQMISKDRLPSSDELFGLPYFDKTCDEDFGRIRFMGVDELGHQVYVVGRKSMGNRYSNIITSVAGILGTDQKILAVDCMHPVNLSMKLGGFTSRRMGLVAVGRAVLARGTLNAFFELVRLVEVTRIKLMEMME